MAPQIVGSDSLRRFCSSLFKAEGVPEDEADLVADVLVEADLTGVASHGVSRVHSYLHRLRQGGCRRVARVEVLRDLPSGAALDGCGSLGQIVACRAMKLAVTKATATGVGVVTAHACNHTGANAYYARMAAEAGHVALVAGNGPPMMAPWGGTAAVFSTNPLSFGVPAGHHTPCIVADMATSVSARGNILLAAKNGTPIPAGWAMDADGNDTTNPLEALKGALLNFGGHKGYAIALMVEVLAGLLSGAGPGSRMNELCADTPAKSGNLFAAINVSLLTDMDQFRTSVDDLAHAITQSRPRPGVQTVILPGDRERTLRTQRLETGIPLSEAVYKDLTIEAGRYGFEPPNAHP